MSLNEILLVCAALLPAIALAIYIYCKDRAEKEPFWLLALLLIGGALICFPAAFLETIWGDTILSLFSGFAEISEDGTMYLPTILYYIYEFVDNFLNIALIEEGLKWLVLILLTRKSKHFNSVFDGLIYAVFVSLGFAALENVLYVTSYGWSNAVVRALLAVPGHMFDGVIMGYFYSLYHMVKIAHEQERIFKQTGLLRTGAPEFSEKSYLFYSILAPVAAHGFYDFCCSVDSWKATIALLIFVAALYYNCFKQIRAMSRCDVDDKTYAYYLLFKKYPGLAEAIKAFNAKVKEAQQNVSQ